MLVGIYAVKDELAGAFMAPTTIKSEEEAIRAFKTQINSVDIWRENPGDFSLYRLGNYEDTTGEITAKTEMIAGGRSVLNG